METTCNEAKLVVHTVSTSISRVKSVSLPCVQFSLWWSGSARVQSKSLKVHNSNVTLSQVKLTNYNFDE